MLRKKWITPQLIVLVRGKSEEGVLQTCKSITPLPVGPYGANWNGEIGCGFLKVASDGTTFACMLCVAS